VTVRHLFEGVGVEIEWMTVAAESFAVRPLAPMLLTDDAGVVRDERDRGELGWSNELATHVIEAKTLGVPASLDGLGGAFLGEARAIAALLEPHGGRLLGGGAHPRMDPATDATLWDGGQSEIYEAYDRIFTCAGHGWVNLQSVHLNLAFDGDDELHRLHRAVRLVLPLIPALSAASPYLEGRRQPYLDARLDTYRRNQARVPQIAGLVVPEPILGVADYHATILAPMYAAIAPHDPEGLLQDEWLNSRGAIVRFDRSALEVRVIDCQETPTQDLAICAQVVEVIRALTDGRLAAEGHDDAASTEHLAKTFWSVAKDADEAVIDDPALLRSFGFEGEKTAADVWRSLAERFPPASEHHAGLEAILDEGPLARRMVRTLGDAPEPEALTALMSAMSECLVAGSPLP